MAYCVGHSHQLGDWPAPFLLFPASEGAPGVGAPRSGGLPYAEPSCPCQLASVLLCIAAILTLNPLVLSLSANLCAILHLGLLEHLESRYEALQGTQE